VILELRGVRFSWRGEEVLRGVSLSVGEGEVVAVKGRSGVGKTTLARIAALLLEPCEGEVAILGRVPRSQGERSELRLRHVGYVDQACRMVPTIKVWENVALPLLLLGWSRSEARRAAEEALSLLGVPEIADRRPWEVSGGQRQRAAIARALVKRPSLIVADEPFSSLDDESARVALEALAGYARKAGAGVLITTTDLSWECPSCREHLLRGGSLLPAR